MFHTLYSLAVADNYIGRQFVANTISMNNNIMIILKQIEYERKAINQTATSAAATGATTDTPANGTTLSPILNYAVDLIDTIVRYTSTNLEYLRTHGLILVNLIKSHDQFGPIISQILQDLAVYLKPLEISNPFSYDNIMPLCEVIKRSTEFITTFPGDLIIALRIIRYLAIPSIPLDSSSDLADTFGDAGATNSLMQNKGYLLELDQHQVELKYKFVILQFYSADGISTCASILEKITTYFTQPMAHSAALSTSQGVLATQILLPTMELLRKMLTYVIECRNTEFKDLTTIEPMLKTYTLMAHISQSISSAAADAQQIQSEIVKTLMAYTQPTPVTGVDTESVHKSLWTQMIGELIKYILSGPHAFMSGLSLFTHLLPIPLPLPAKRPLTASETTRLVTERQLWSAHLHPKSIAISEMIQTLCISTYAPLLDLLSRVIVQLADLAPNMSLLITKATIDLLLSDGTSSIIQTNDLQNAATVSTTTPTTPTSLTSTQAQQPSLVMTYINPQTKRVLSFLANILCFPCVKVAFLSIIHGKVYEFLIKIVGVKTASLPSHLWPILVQEQECVLTIFHTILNADVTMLTTDEPSVVAEKSILSPETIIASALPPKECLSGIIASVVDNFLCIDEQLSVFANQFAALKTLMILTEYE